MFLTIIFIYHLIYGFQLELSKGALEVTASKIRKINSILLISYKKLRAKTSLYFSDSKFCPPTNSVKNETHKYDKRI